MRVAIRDIGIPPRPTILAQFETEMARSSPDFIRLARLLSTDVAISAALVKTANSPLFSLGKPVASIDEALMVLGLRMIASTLAGLSLKQAFDHVPNMERFWVTSASIAQLTRWLARRLRRPSMVRPEDAYTYALFRDCGIPMLASPFPEYRDALNRASLSADRPFTEIEDEAIALNHAIVGAELTEDWRLPEEVCLAIRHHHDLSALENTTNTPLGLPARQMIALAQLAEHLIQTNTGLMKNLEWEKLGASCCVILEIDTATLDELNEEYRDALKSS